MFKAKHCTGFIVFFDVTRNGLALKQIIFLKNVRIIKIDINVKIAKYVDLLK